MCTYQRVKHRELWNLITDLKYVPLHLQATMGPSLETELKEYLYYINTTQTWK